MTELAAPAFDPAKVYASREGYGEGLLQEGRKHPNIVALDADLSDSTRSLRFGKEFPDRFFNMGISEQDMIVTAAGMAAQGKVCFASTFAIFMERAFEQIRNAVARPNLDVKIVGSHGGLMTGEDGSSAQCIEDVAIYRSLPNFAVVVAADAVEAQKAVTAMVDRPGPSYLRLTRAKVPVLFGPDHVFEFGKGQRLREGDDVTLAACGPLVAESLEAAKSLSAAGIEADVLNLASVKPLDRPLLVESAARTGLVVTAEDHNVVGGLGSAVAEALSEEHPTRLVRVGLQDRFAESGSPKALYDKYGLSAARLAEAVTAAVSIRR